MAEQKYPQGSTLKEITQFIARQKQKGAPVERIVRQLMQRGWPEQSARQFVDNVQVTSGECSVPRSAPLSVQHTDVREQRAVRRHYLWRVLRGLLLVILGLIIIGMGLSMTDVYKGLYHFTMGVLLCIFETIDFVAGLTGWWKNRN